MPNLGSSSSAANIDMMENIMNGDIIICLSKKHYQGVRSRRKVCESHRLWKNHVQINFPIRPRTYEKSLLNLFKSSKPNISTSTSTMLASKLLKICVRLFYSVYLIKTKLRIFRFLKVDEHSYPYLVFSCQ